MFIEAWKWEHLLPCTVFHHHCHLISAWNTCCAPKHADLCGRKTAGTGGQVICLFDFRPITHLPLLCLVLLGDGFCAHLLPVRLSQWRHGWKKGKLGNTPAPPPLPAFSWAVTTRKVTTFPPWTQLHHTASSWLPFPIPHDGLSPMVSATGSSGGISCSPSSRVPAHSSWVWWLSPLPLFLRPSSGNGFLQLLISGLPHPPPLVL